MTKPLRYDPSALDVARAMVDIVSPDDAFLFGSRARGDWTDQSDIDVLTIAEQRRDTRSTYQKALRTGHAMAVKIYGRPVKIDLVRYSSQDFQPFIGQLSSVLRSRQGAMRQMLDAALEWRKQGSYGAEYASIATGLANWEYFKWIVDFQKVPP